MNTKQQIMTHIPTNHRQQYAAWLMQQSAMLDWHLQEIDPDDLFHNIEISSGEAEELRDGLRHIALLIFQEPEQRDENLAVQGAR